MNDETIRARRDFIKKAGKFAAYTSPAIMMLMYPSRDAISNSIKSNYGDATSNSINSNAGYDGSPHGISDINR